MGSFGREAALQIHLIEAGNKLLNPPSSVDGLLNLLDQVETLLSNVEQAPSRSMQDALGPSMKGLMSHNLLEHPDVNVRVFVASCLTEITRIAAPDAPYNDEEMKAIFQLTVSAFKELADMSSPRYRRTEFVLDTVSKVRSCLIMLDLECDELIIEMFQLFLKIIRSDHPSVVFLAMETIMITTIQESEDISSDLLDTILASVRTENENVSPISWKLGKKVLSGCAHKLKPYIVKALKTSGNDLDMFSPVVASICPNYSISIRDHDMVHTEEFEKDENKTTKPTVASEPLEASMEIKLDTVCPEKSSQDLDDCSVPSENNTDLRNRNSSNAEIRSVILPRKRIPKPNSLMNPDEGYERSWNSAERKSVKTPSSKKPHNKRHDFSSSSEKSVSKKVPLPQETPNLSPKISRPLVLSLPCSSSGLTKVWGKKKEASCVRTAIRTPLHVENSVTIESEEAYEVGSMPKWSRKCGDAERTLASKNKDGVQVDHEEKVVKEPVLEAKMISIGKRSRVRSFTKKKDLENARKKMTSPVATKSLGERMKNSPKSNWKRKRGARGEALSEKSGLGEELVGRRIRVWWPLDKIFYEGVVDLYDNVRKRHRVLYTDGEAEILKLETEIWELVGNDVLAKEKDEMDPLKSNTLSDMLRKQKERIRKDSAKQNLAGSSMRRKMSAVKISGQKGDVSEKSLTVPETKPEATKTKGGHNRKSQVVPNTKTEISNVDMNPEQNDTAVV